MFNGLLLSRASSEATHTADIALLYLKQPIRGRQTVSELRRQRESRRIPLVDCSEAKVIVAARATPIVVKTILLTIALGLGPSAGAWAQGDGCKALESTLKDAQVLIDITPFAQREKPVCRIDQGCLEVDWNVATKQ